MPASIQELLQQLSSNSELQATLLVAIAALAGLLYLLKVRVRRWRNERRIRKIIQRLGARRLDNITLPDGTGGEVLIEHLLLAPDSLLIVGIMRFDGLIFGGHLTEQWTQVLGRRSYKFENPQKYLQRQINAISQLVPGTPVSGRHIFPHARFPKDKPESVIVLSDFRSLPGKPRMKQISPALRTAWEKVVEAVG